MSTLADQVAEYLALRRSLGFVLKREEQLLGQFVAYFEAAGAENLRSELAIAWAQLPTVSPNEWAKRLGVVRRFAVYLRTIDDTVEVPPSGVFPTTRARPTPYLFSERDDERLLEAARGDVDVDTGVITIHHAKFDRTRLVPLHESTTMALSSYAATRDKLCPRPRVDVFVASRFVLPFTLGEPSDSGPQRDAAAASRAALTGRAVSARRRQQRRTRQTEADGRLDEALSSAAEAPPVGAVLAIFS